MLKFCSKCKKAKELKDFQPFKGKLKVPCKECKHKYNKEYFKKTKGYDYVRLDDYQFISYFKDGYTCHKEGHGRSISWSEGNKQPVDEWIYSVGFSTGAYIFGEDYNGQQQLFQDFFEELRTHKPDYEDLNNHCLYWKVENAKEIMSQFKVILTKYRDRNRDELKARKKVLKKYHQSKKGKKAVNEASKRSYTNHKEKWIARAKARYAVSKGILIKPKKCEVCEKILPLQGHHEDYAKPLEVIWLCTSCHAEADKLLESSRNL